MLNDILFLKEGAELMYCKPQLIEYGNLFDTTHAAGAGSFCDVSGSMYNNYSG